MSLAAVTLTDVKQIWLMYVGLFFNRCIFSHDKILPNPKMTIVRATLPMFTYFLRSNGGLTQVRFKIQSWHYSGSFEGWNL